MDLQKVLTDYMRQHQAKSLGYDLSKPDDLRKIQIDEMALSNLLGRVNIFQPGGTPNPTDMESAQQPKTLGGTWETAAKMRLLQKLLEHVGYPKIRPDGQGGILPNSGGSAP